MSHALQTLRFRPFAAEDAPLLGGWLAAVGLGVPKGVATEAWSNRMIHDPHISCWAADRQGTTLGFFRLDTGPDRQAELTLIVAPSERRGGLGRRMLDEALGHARSRGLSRVRVVVNEKNTSALEFFAAAGFAESASKTPEFIHLHRLIHRAERQPPLEI